MKSCAKAKTGRPSTRPGAGDDAVAGDDLLVHAEIAAAVRDELVDFVERSGIEQQIDPLARRQLAGVVLPFEAILAAAEFGAALEVCEMRHGPCTGPATLTFRSVLSPSPSGTSQPDVGQRVLEQRVDHGRRTGADVRAQARRFDDVDRAACEATSTSVLNS